MRSPRTISWFAWTIPAFALMLFIGQARLLAFGSFVPDLPLALAIALSVASGSWAVALFSSVSIIALAALISPFYAIPAAISAAIFLAAFSAIRFLTGTRIIDAALIAAASGIVGAIIRPLVFGAAPDFWTVLASAFATALAAVIFAAAAYRISQS